MIFNTFQKKIQKTAKDEIVSAVKIMKEYFSNK
jgi:hypothetical protein